MIILKEKKYGGLYKLKEGNSVRSGVSRIAWKGVHCEVEFQGRLQRDVNRVKVLREGEMVHSDKA